MTTQLDKTALGEGDDMTRPMKASDSSITNPMIARMCEGKFFERSRPGRWSHQVGVKRFCCTIVLLLCLMIAGCVRQEDGLVGEFQTHGRVMKEFQTDNARFEFPLASIQPGSRYWMVKGEDAILKSDSMELHWEQVGTMCEFTDNTSTDACSICDYCSNMPNGVPADVPCFGVLPVFAPYDAVVAYDAFGMSPTPALVLDGQDLIHLCLPGSLVTFQPETSATYQFRLMAKHDTFTTAAERRIHVLERGEARSQLAAFPLVRERVNEMVGGTDYWTWAVPGGTNWLENFSPNLRVTAVGLLKGKCVNDPNSGLCTVTDEMPGVTASRVLFLSDFQGTVEGHPQRGVNRCYSHPNEIEDRVFINLDQCRNTNSTSPNLLTTERPVTPTYDHLQPMAKLKWLVEFNTSEGGDADLMTPCHRPTPVDPSTAGCDPPNSNDELIIVFRIEAR